MSDRFERLAKGPLPALAGAVAMIALIAVWQFGDFDVADKPPPAVLEIGDMERLVDELERRLAVEPGDAAEWQTLARAYSKLGRFQDSADAYAKAIARGADGAPVQSAHGEAMTLAADGQVTAAALAAFEKALGIDPMEPRARYYVALAKAQDGKLAEALDLWLSLEAESAADAPWRASLTARIEQTAVALGRDPKTLPGR
jgi:cytochrome c-type biogenesis protein CcmH